MTAIRAHIALIAGLVMILLALNMIAERPSLVVNHYEDRGIPHEVQAGLLIAGAVVLALENGAITFILGTLPYAVYCLTTVYITLDRGGGYPTGIIYLFSYLQLWALYAPQKEC